MPFSNSGNNVMLDALPVTHLSLHSSFPGAGGANEISGGSPAYARKAVTFGAAAAAARGQSGSSVFDVASGTTVQYIGLWSALTAGTFYGYSPMGSATPREFVADLAGDLLRIPAHGLANDNQVVFLGGTPPAPLAEGTIYFVVGAATDTYQVAATLGGAAINITAHGGTGVQAVRIIPETLGSQGTVTISGSALELTF